MEALPCALEQRGLPLDHRAEVDALFGELGRREIRIGEQAVVAEQLGRDEQWIPGERRKQLIGRVAVAGRPEWQHLPEALPGVGEEANERVRFGPEVANAERSGQRRRMEQKPGAAHRLRAWSGTAPDARRLGHAGAPARTNSSASFGAL